MKALNVAVLAGVLSFVGDPRSASAADEWMPWGWQSSSLTVVGQEMSAEADGSSYAYFLCRDNRSPASYWHLVIPSVPGYDSFTLSQVQPVSRATAQFLLLKLSIGSTFRTENLYQSRYAMILYLAAPTKVSF